MNDATSVPLTTDTRYIVTGTDVLDRDTGRIARFQNAGVAQIGADWLNTPDATPEDYEWTDNADPLDEGPMIGDLLRAADLLRVTPSALVEAIAPLLLEKRARTLRRPADVDDRLRELDD
ncbi:hypothetical protein MZK47_02560 [Microbacterium aerolatum]|uniref:hypothetical protein n=1 Tax=Microbacterium aerolatum TaxID=153731 RepID=UPI0020012BD7|nr:hypothetical protein [Microbacterium aerolatum]MCK3768553.1 hypothetical protein [Microbacterium aerolatum]